MLKTIVHKDQFAQWRPWQWWIESSQGIIHWGGNEWTEKQAADAADRYISSLVCSNKGKAAYSSIYR